MVTRKIIFRSCALSQASAESHEAIGVKRQNVGISFGFNTKKSMDHAKMVKGVLNELKNEG
jgi:hypothetical protein